MPAAKIGRNDPCFCGSGKLNYMGQLLERSAKRVVDG
jgi:hypothetical protein